MKFALLLCCFGLVGIVNAQQTTPYDEQFASARINWDVPSEAQLKLHLAAFGLSISKHDIDFSALRDGGWQTQFVYARSGDIWKLHGFFYRLPTGKHGLKRFYFQAFSSIATKADDKLIAPTSLYLGKPGKERLDQSWFRTDLSEQEQRDIALGNFDVMMFGHQFRPSVTVTFKPWVSRAGQPVPYLLRLIWPDGRWVENGQTKVGERIANFTISVQVR